MRRICLPYALTLSIRSQAQEELFKNLNGSAEGRIRIWFGLRQILNATDPLLLETRPLPTNTKLESTWYEPLIDSFSILPSIS